MEIVSKYTKSFRSNGLNCQKYDELQSIVSMLRDHNNDEYIKKVFVF